MNYFKRLLVAAISSLVLSACVNMPEVDVSIHEVQAISIAESFILLTYPDFDKNQKKIVIKSIEDLWEVTYELPDGMLGGAPVVLVEKRTGRIVRSFRTQ